MRSLLLTIALGALVVPAHAQSLEVIGYSGHLGEWELTATVAQTAPDRKGYSGPLMMKHVGVCTQDEGGFAIVTNAGLDAVDADVLVTNSMRCGRRSRVVLTPRRWRQVLRK